MSRLQDVAPVMAVLDHPHGLLEAPRFAAGGELVYSDVLAGGVWACAPDGALRELLPKRRGVGGIVPHASGGWVISGRTVVHLTADGSQRVLLADDAARGYNDLATTARGDLLAGVLRYRPLAGEAPTAGQLVRLARDGSSQVLNEQIIWPNGIGVSPDGLTIYISDYARRVVLAIPAQGGQARELCAIERGSPDGLAVDAQGGVWVALGDAGAVARLGPDGTLDEVIELPAGFVSSLCFGRADMREVLITTADNQIRPELGGTLLRARSELAGLPVAPAAV
jgi:sugar lactone lactonase YvrE